MPMLATDVTTLLSGARPDALTDLHRHGAHV